MTLSPRCSGYYTQLQGEEVAQGRGRCGECREEVPAAKHLQDNNNTWLEDSGRTSGSQTDEDMKVGRRELFYVLCEIEQEFTSLIHLSVQGVALE